MDRSTKKIIKNTLLTFSAVFIAAGAALTIAGAAKGGSMLRVAQNLGMQDINRLIPETQGMSPYGDNGNYGYGDGSYGYGKGGNSGSNGNGGNSRSVIPGYGYGSGGNSGSNNGGSYGYGNGGSSGGGNYGYGNGGNSSGSGSNQGGSNGAMDDDELRDFFKQFGIDPDDFMGGDSAGDSGNEYGYSNGNGNENGSGSSGQSGSGSGKSIY